MNLPIDPTKDHASPQELIQNLPSQTAKRRVLQAADISLDVGTRSFVDSLDECTEIELRRAASQTRFAGARTVYYYTIDGLHRVSLEGVTGRADDVGSPGVYGPEVQTALRDHDRIYLVCNVPETGSQTQLTLSKANRPTTVAVFKPRTQLLAVRAPNSVTADATVQAVTSYLGGDDWARVSFLKDGFRGRFEDACVERYSTIRLRSKNTRGDGVEVEVTASESEDGHWSDVRSDPIVEALLRRGDTELEAATGLISVPTDVRTVANNEPFHPRVTIGFPAGRVTFEEFVPEQVLLAVDDLVQGCR